MPSVGPHAQWRGGRAAGAVITLYSAALVNGQPVGTTDPEEAQGALVEVDGAPALDTEESVGLRISVVGDNRIFAH